MIKVQQAVIYRIFGWQPIRDFHRQENVNYMNGAPADGLSETDSLILRWPVATRADLTPLIHSWGIHAVNAAALKAKLAERAIGPSSAVRSHIERYKTIAPRNNAQFNAHYERVYPGRPAGGHPDYGTGWYNARRNTFNESDGARIQAGIQAVLDL